LNAKIRTWVTELEGLRLSTSDNKPNTTDMIRYPHQGLRFPDTYTRPGNLSTVC
jgi:hypothetical protein